jgi:hypothetical protein
MTIEQLLPGIIGAFVGAFGWLIVGLFIQRQQFARQAKNAARAVYFELDSNTANVQFAVDLGAFTPLARSSYERVLPELATWLPPEELRMIVTAYMSHAGYHQLSADGEVPEPVRGHVLGEILQVNRRARELLGRRVFSDRERRLMEQSPAGGAP